MTGHPALEAGEPGAFQIKASWQLLPSDAQPDGVRVRNMKARADTGEGVGSGPGFVAPSAPAPQPHNPAARRREEAIQEASRSIIELYLERGTTDLPVKELAAHVGLAERTFYRYFPRKEEAVRPYVVRGFQRIVRAVRAAPSDANLREVLVASHAEAFREGRDKRWDAFVPLLLADEGIRAVWLQVVAEAEKAFAEVVAERLGIDPRGQRARMAGAVLTLAGRLAMEQPFGDGEKGDPARVFAECLAHVGPGLFEPVG